MTTGRSVSLPANGSVAPVTRSAAAVAKALRTLRAGSFDVVHVHEPFAPGLPFGLLVGRGLPPIVATFHRSGRSPFYDALSPLTRRLARRFARPVRGVPGGPGHGGAGAGRAATTWGSTGSRSTGSSRWSPGPGPGPTVLFLGRHEERKGLGVLLAAFEACGRGQASGSPNRPGRPVARRSCGWPETGPRRPASAGATPRHPTSSGWGS